MSTNKDTIDTLWVDYPNKVLSDILQGSAGLLNFRCQWTNVFYGNVMVQKTF